MIVAAALLPLLAIVGVLLWSGNAETEAQVMRERLTLAQSTALVVDLFLSDNVHALEVLGREGSRAVDDRDVTGAAKALADAAAINPNWENVGLVDSRGLNVLPSATAPARSVSVADRAYFQNAIRTGRPIVSDAIVGRFSGRPTVVIAVPVTLGSGDRGLLTGILSLAFLNERLLSLPRPPETEVVVTDRAGRTIVHPDPEALASLRDLSRLPSVQLALAGEAGVFRRVVEGTDLVAAYAPARVAGWGVTVRQPTSAAFALIHSEVAQGAAITALGAFLALVLAWSLGGRLQHYHDDAVETQRRAAREKDELLTSVGHELKTPLASVSMAAEMVVRVASRGGTPDQLQRYVDLIRDQVARASGFITALLESSRLEQIGSPRRERVDLAVVVRAVVERQREFLPDPSLYSIELSPSSDQPVVLEGDASRLDHVITNLLTNAVKYSPDGGRVEVRLEHEADRARVIVADHGIGIPRDEHESVFSPFARSRAAVERGIEGTGLGLYLSKRIVESHGGAISVAETPGGGTTMMVDLPAHAAAPA